MRTAFLLFICVCGLFFSSCRRDTRVVCVGDSITEGAGMNDQSRTAYPVVLGQILGPGYHVINCGRSGATMLKQSDLPYWKCKDFYNVFTSVPDVVVIALGTNDSKNFNWNAERFEKDFQAMIDTLRTLKPGPRIYVCLPPPVFKMAWSIDDSTIVHGVIPIILKLKKTNDFTLIDLNHSMRGRPELFPDGVHPDEAGARVMAGIIAAELKK